MKKILIIFVVLLSFWLTTNASDSRIDNILSKFYTKIWKYDTNKQISILWKVSNNISKAIVKIKSDKNLLLLNELKEKIDLKMIDFKALNKNNDLLKSSINKKINEDNIKIYENNFIKKMNSDLFKEAVVKFLVKNSNYINNEDYENFYNNIHKLDKERLKEAYWITWYKDFEKLLSKDKGINYKLKIEDISAKDIFIQIPFNNYYINDTEWNFRWSMIIVKNIWRVSFYDSFAWKRVVENTNLLLNAYNVLSSDKTSEEIIELSNNPKFVKLIRDVRIYNYWKTTSDYHIEWLIKYYSNWSSNLYFKLFEDNKPEISYSKVKIKLENINDKSESYESKYIDISEETSIPIYLKNNDLLTNLAEYKVSIYRNWKVVGTWQFRYY